ncbi:DUF4892 domain-containing protein [Pseudomonas sp. DC3000-4b1]|uniref:DUF4892 domain-containing protein n=1 Tax=unclassified Pseudomonas TaxID=196821 RepID=UPI003CF4259F
MPYPLRRFRPWLSARHCPLPLILALSLSAPVLAASSPEAFLETLGPAQGRLLEQRGLQVVERLYPLGSLRRIGSTLRMEGRVEQRGDLASMTWELPAEHSAAQAFKVARQALRARGAQFVFWCEGRECGDSNLWANDIFASRYLLGNDDQQAFLLAREAAGDPGQLVAVYAVVRGNRTAALLAETFQPSQPLGPLLPTPGTLLRELREAERLGLSELSGPPSEAWVALLARTLNLDSTLQVRLVGTQALAWRNALAMSGVRASRLGLGESASEGLILEVVR